VPMRSTSMVSMPTNGQSSFSLSCYPSTDSLQVRRLHFRNFRLHLPAAERLRIQHPHLLLRDRLQCWRFSHI
jgi:hypothetical protein